MRFGSFSMRSLSGCGASAKSTATTPAMSLSRNCRTVARPMPEAAPVTIADLPQSVTFIARLFSGDVADDALEGGAGGRVAFLGDAAGFIRQPACFNRVLHRDCHLHRFF